MLFLRDLNVKSRKSRSALLAFLSGLSTDKRYLNAKPRPSFHFASKWKIDDQITKMSDHAQFTQAVFNVWKSMIFRHELQEAVVFKFAKRNFEKDMCHSTRQSSAGPKNLVTLGAGEKS